MVKHIYGKKMHVQTWSFNEIYGLIRTNNTILNFKNQKIHKENFNASYLKHFILYYRFFS